MSDPEFSYGTGRGQINLKGRDAIRAGGWAIRFLLLARAIAILVTAAAIALCFWRLTNARASVGDHLNFNPWVTFVVAPLDMQCRIWLSVNDARQCIE